MQGEAKTFSGSGVFDLDRSQSSGRRCHVNFHNLSTCLVRLLSDLLGERFGILLLFPNVEPTLPAFWIGNARQICQIDSLLRKQAGIRLEMCVFCTIRPRDSKSQEFSFRISTRIFYAEQGFPEKGNVRSMTVTFDFG